MSETSARARRLAFWFGSFARNGFGARFAGPPGGGTTGVGAVTFETTDWGANGVTVDPSGAGITGGIAGGIAEAGSTGDETGVSTGVCAEVTTGVTTGGCGRGGSTGGENGCDVMVRG